MRSLSVFLLSVFSFCFASSIFRGVTGAAVSQECSDDFQKVMACLNYATGKANTPSKECCSSVKDIKDSDPKCLCYIMQQTHSGSDQIKSLGIQEAKLLQLPSACQLQNASISQCPKLLGLSPSSPDAAIFTNVSSVSTPASAATQSSSGKSEGSNATKHKPHLASPLVFAMAIFVNAFPAGSASIFHTWG